MGREELLQDAVVAFSLLVQRQVHLEDFRFRTVLFHVTPESHLPVLLLAARHLPVLRLPHEHDGLFLSRHEHEHPRRKPSALNGVLSVERQRLQGRHIGIEQDERDVAFVQFVGEGTRQLQRRRDKNHAVRILLQAFLVGRDKGMGVQPAVIHDFQVDVKVPAHLDRLQGPRLDFLPVSLAGMLRQETVEGIALVVGQCTGIDVGLVVHLLEHLLHPLQGRRRHVGAFVQHSVNRPDTYAGALRNVFDSDLFRHR